MRDKVFLTVNVLINLGLIAILTYLFMRPNWMNSGWFILGIIASLVVFFSAMRTSMMLALACLYSLAYTIFLIFTKLSYIETIDFVGQINMRLEMSKAIIILLCFYIIFIKMPKRILDDTMKALAIVFFVNIPITIICYILDTRHTGIFVNSSVSATTMAILLPIYLKVSESNKLWNNISPFVFVIGAFSLVLTKATIGLAAYLLCGMVYFFYKNRSVFYAALALSAVSTFALISTQGISKALSVTHRDKIWSLTSRWIFSEDGNTLLGQGMGSYYALMPKIQQYFLGGDQGHGIYVTAHNDILELLFNLGIVGALLWIIYFTTALFRNRSDTFVISFFVSFLISALGNFPTHTMVPSLCLVVWMKYCYFKKSGEIE